MFLPRKSLLILVMIWVSSCIANEMSSIVKNVKQDQPTMSQIKAPDNASSTEPDIVKSTPDTVENNALTEEDNAMGKQNDESLGDILGPCKGDSLVCTLKAVLSFMGLLDSKRSLEVLGNYVTVEKTDTKPGEDEEVPEKDADPAAALASRLERYLRSHVVQLRFPELQDSAVSNTNEGRGRLRKLILPLVLFTKLLFAILLPIAMSVIALLSFKGLWAGLAALLVSAALGLKALFTDANNNSPSTRFSLGFLKPHHILPDYHDYWGGGGWSRSIPHPEYRAEPYRGYYPSSSWDRPAAK